MLHTAYHLLSFGIFRSCLFCTPTIHLNCSLLFLISTPHFMHDTSIFSASNASRTSVSIYDTNASVYLSDYCDACISASIFNDSSASYIDTSIGYASSVACLSSSICNLYSSVRLSNLLLMYLYQIVSTFWSIISLYHVSSSHSVPPPLISAYIISYVPPFLQIYFPIQSTLTFLQLGDPLLPVLPLLQILSLSRKN